MVTFTNIKFNSDWVYANAYDHDNKISSKVKIHRTKSNIIELDCRDSVQIIMAAWALKRYVNKGKIKQGGSHTVAWG